MLKDTKGNEGRRGLMDAKKMRESMDGDIVEMEGVVLLNSRVCSPCEQPIPPPQFLLSGDDFYSYFSW